MRFLPTLMSFLKRATGWSNLAHSSCIFWNFSGISWRFLAYCSGIVGCTKQTVLSSALTVSRPENKRSITKSFTVPDGTRRVTWITLTYLGAFFFGMREVLMMPRGRIISVPGAKLTFFGVTLRSFHFLGLSFVKEMSFGSSSPTSSIILGSRWIAGGSKSWLSMVFVRSGTLSASATDCFPYIIFSIVLCDI